MLVTAAAYLLVGAIAIGIAAGVRPFPGYPLGLIPYWPIGVGWVLFSERLFEPQELIVLSSVGATFVLGTGLIRPSPIPRTTEERSSHRSGI